MAAFGWASLTFLSGRAPLLCLKPFEGSKRTPIAASVFLGSKKSYPIRRVKVWNMHLMCHIKVHIRRIIDKLDTFIHLGVMLAITLMYDAVYALLL